PPTSASVIRISTRGRRLTGGTLLGALSGLALRRMRSDPCGVRRRRAQGRALLVGPDMDRLLGVLAVFRRPARTDRTATPGRPDGAGDVRRRRVAARWVAVGPGGDVADSGGRGGRRR